MARRPLRVMGSELPQLHTVQKEDRDHPVAVRVEVAVRPTDSASTMRQATLPLVSAWTLESQRNANAWMGPSAITPLHALPCEPMPPAERHHLVIAHTAPGRVCDVALKARSTVLNH
jgi:hypothetical protein